MSDDQRRPDSQKSRQELLDEIYYLRDVAGEREQQVRRLQARIDRTLWGRARRLTGALRWLARAIRGVVRGGQRSETTGAGGGVDAFQSLPASITPGVETRIGDQKHLYVDITALELHGGMTGVQRVTREIVMALLAAPPRGFEVRPVYAAPGQSYRLAQGPNADSERRNHPVDRAHALIDARADDIFLGLDHSLQAVVEREHDFETMHERGVRLWFVCNDVLPLTHPEWFPPEVPPKFEAWLRAVVRTADGVACISRTTEAGLSQWLDTWRIQRDRPLALGHFGLGADPAIDAAESRMISGEESAVLGRLGGTTTFLMVGTLEPRKGHAQTLEAFNQLWANGDEVALVIVGPPGWMTEVTQRRIRHHEEFGQRLFWFMQASDALLEKLYATCTVLLAVSEGEGFGLPLVEAARHGLPILCRDLPVFREVAGTHATYFDGRDPDSLVRAIRTWIDARDGGGAPDTRNMPCLSWVESAAQLMKLVLGDSESVQVPETPH